MRVADYRDVFTSTRMVKSMLDLVKEETKLVKFVVAQT